MPDDRFDHPSYTIRKKVVTLAGAKFHIFDARDRLVFFSKQKAFKLKEDIRLYEGEAMQEELLILSARHVIDFGATYDVVDPNADETIGSLRRSPLKSMVRDEWLIYDRDERHIATITEDATALAVLRRVNELFSLIAPQAHNVELNGIPVARFEQNRNPFVHKTAVSITDGPDNTLDRRITIAAAMLIAAIEGRQN